MYKFEVSGEIIEREPFKCCRNTGSGAALPNDLNQILFLISVGREAELFGWTLYKRIKQKDVSMFRHKTI